MGEFTTDLLALVEQTETLERELAFHPIAGELHVFRQSMVRWTCSFIHSRTRLQRACTAYEFWELARIVPARLWAIIHRLRGDPDVQRCLRFCWSTTPFLLDIETTARLVAIRQSSLHLLERTLSYTVQFEAFLLELRNGQSWQKAQRELQMLQERLA